jgi:phosphoribosylanthranilate isomerase
MPIIKICGQTTLADAELCLHAGAEWLGFIFYPKSKRAVQAAAVAPWLTTLAGRAERVGVFVNESTRVIRDLWEQGLIDRAQLHGAESRDEAADLASAGVPLIRAIRVTREADLDGLDLWSTDTVLLDGPEPGSGHVFDWHLAATAVQRYPQLRLMLAGGLHPENVAAGVHTVRPWGVDVATGVEAAPGVKDAERVRAFIQAARKSPSH